MVARPMLSAMFISGGINSLKNAEQMVTRSKPVLDKVRPSVERMTASLPVEVSDTMLVRANGALHVLAGSMLATGRAPRLASLALAASLVPTTLGGHRFWEESEPQQRAAQKLQFTKNVSIMGGLLLAGVDTEGRPSIAWRARRQARKTQEQASSLIGH